MSVNWGTRSCQAASVSDHATSASGVGRSGLASVDRQDEVAIRPFRELEVEDERLASVAIGARGRLCGSGEVKLDLADLAAPDASLVVMEVSNGARRSRRAG